MIWRWIECGQKKKKEQTGRGLSHVIGRLTSLRVDPIDFVEDTSFISIRIFGSIQSGGPLEDYTVWPCRVFKKRCFRGLNVKKGSKI